LLTGEAVEVVEFFFCDRHCKTLPCATGRNSLPRGGVARQNEATFDSRSPDRVGRYGVEREEFSTPVQGEPERPQDEGHLFVIDEIGQMKCCCDAFLRAMRRLSNETAPLLASVAQKGDSLIREANQRSDVERIAVTRQNREALPTALAQRYQSNL
jgi:nucleoside-triphosphatase THEP1